MNLKFQFLQCCSVCVCECVCEHPLKCVCVFVTLIFHFSFFTSDLHALLIFQSFFYFLSIFIFQNFTSDSSLSVEYNHMIRFFKFFFTHFTKALFQNQPLAARITVTLNDIPCELIAITLALAVQSELLILLLAELFSLRSLLAVLRSSIYRMLAIGSQKLISLLLINQYDCV